MKLTTTVTLYDSPEDRWARIMGDLTPDGFIARYGINCQHEERPAIDAYCDLHAPETTPEERSSLAEHLGIPSMEPPPVEDICGAMAALRAQDAVMNAASLTAPLPKAYSRPMLCVTHSVTVIHNGMITNPADECAFLEVPWDHTKWSLIEAIDTARRMGGRVFIQQDWIVPRTPSAPSDHDHHHGFWAEELDCGFSLQVWPTFTGRDHYQKDQRADSAVFAAHLVSTGVTLPSIGDEA